MCTDTKGHATQWPQDGTMAVSEGGFRDYLHGDIYMYICVVYVVYIGIWNDISVYMCDCMCMDVGGSTHCDRRM